MRKFIIILFILLTCAGCAAKEAPRVTLPEKLSRDGDGAPTLNVYDAKNGEIARMGIEEYLYGVVAGEMRGDWPEEALKSQAILARTFVVKFCSEKESRYAGADISTDIEEAQAYDEAGINARVRAAVDGTRGEVLLCGGELPYAWFHAHSGGMTAPAKEGLNYKASAPYTRAAAGEESEKAPEDAKEWTAEFTQEEVLSAMEKLGAPISALSSAKVARRGESGRATEIELGGKSVSAPELRITLGADRMRSTLLTGLRVENDTLRVSGKGYGHGVGMSQWGAYGMAESGKSAREIIAHYFADAEIVKAW